jgi:sugar/nucleoside kinase (ribokinase family)
MIASHEKRAAVLSIGRIYCDLIFTGLDEMPVLGRELFAGGMDLAAGGGAFISAAHLQAVGRMVALISRLGTDTLSQGIGQQIRDSGVDLRFIEHAVDAGPQVTVAAVVGKERAFLTRRTGPAQPSTLEAALHWPQAQHLHIAEYATLHEMPDLVLRAQANGLSVSLDPSWDASLIYAPGLLGACGGVDVFLPNLEEAEAITGSSDPQTAIRILGKTFPLVALKGGDRGAWATSGDDVIHLPAKAVPVIDTTGAGDAFNAGFLDAWLEGRPILGCLSAGIDAGSLAVQTAGGATPLHSRQPATRK